ncbi:unnamed protein product [Lactuca saligna]|uniref:Uncharacterized protein n=1 Tax=Lactuca saligna TaxID=75948 RepID=A0AA35Z437_LACSI|nr:unnamed protein product [Lactuca saligna]
MASVGSFSYGGFHASDLDIPTEYKLLSMEMHVEMEKHEKRHQPKAPRNKGPDGGDAEKCGYVVHHNPFVDVVFGTNVSWVLLVSVVMISSMVFWGYRLPDYPDYCS